MKKGLKILCAALSLTAIMSFSAFAAETKKEYRAEAEPIRNEMKSDGGADGCSQGIQ